MSDNELRNRVEELSSAMIEYDQLMVAALRPVLECIVEFARQLNDVAWRMYRDAGTPFGETDAGMMRWLMQMSEIYALRAKADRMEEELRFLAEFRQVLARKRHE